MATKKELKAEALELGIEIEGKPSIEELQCLIDTHKVAMCDQEDDLGDLNAADEEHIPTVEDIKSELTEMGIPFDDDASTEELLFLISNEASIDDLKLTAEDLGITVAKNSTREYLIEKIAAAVDENAADEDGEFFTAVNQDCFVLAYTFLVGIPYRLDEWENNKEFMKRFNIQLKNENLKML